MKTLRIEKLSTDTLRKIEEALISEIHSLGMMIHTGKISLGERISLYDDREAIKHELYRLQDYLSGDKL